MWLQVTSDLGSDTSDRHSDRQINKLFMIAISYYQVKTLKKR